MSRPATDADRSEPVPPPPEGVREGVFVVIAAYNEGPQIETTVRTVTPLYRNVVVVDDGSSDGTAGAASRAARFVLRHAINRGQGAALQTGIRFALQRGARHIVTFDADGQHRVEDIAALLEPILEGRAEIALGSRFLGEAVDLPATRRVTLRLAVVFTRIFNGVRLTDAHNGLRAFSRRAAERIDLHQDRMAHASEIIDQVRASGMPFVEVPVQIRYTAYSLGKGQSSRRAVTIALQYLLGRVMR